MTANIEAYPLQWPVGWKRTPRSCQKRSRYDVSFAKARDDLIASLRKLGARQIVISTNIPLKRDGFPYANWREPDDTGIAVYWTLRKQSCVMACDHWNLVRDNIRAIGLSVDALRMLERAGASQILDRAYQGFTALPPDAGHRSWRAVLSVEVAPTQQELKRAYRQRMADVHPDKGGSHEQAVEVQRAYDEALKELFGIDFKG